MGFYSRIIFPWLCDRLIDTPCLNDRRRLQLAGVHGRVLEIGVGTGLNLAHYPAHVGRIATVDPNLGMSRRLRKRMATCGVEVDHHVAGGEQLPFADATFDCAVSTLTLCSVEDPERVMSELFRTLKPGGQLHFLEHGLCPDPRVRRRQRRWNWLQKRLGGGCRLDLNVAELLRSPPFATVRMENFFLERTLKTHGYMYGGVAIK